MDINIKDRRILCVLDANSRITNSQLAKEVKLNQNTTAYRLKFLEKEKYILGYYALIDNSKLGLIGFRVYFKFMDTDEKKEKEMIGHLYELSEIQIIAINDGVYDAGFICWVKNIYIFEGIWSTFKQKYKKYIGKHQIAIFTKIHHFSREYLMGERKNYSDMVVGGSSIETIDKVDEDILKILSNNARETIITISKKLNISVRTIAFRIKRLEKRKIILGYKVNLNLEKLGYKYYKVNFILNELSNIQNLIEFSRQNKYVTYVDVKISPNDFEFDLEVPSRQEFLDIISKFKEKFRNIRKFEEFTIRRYERLRYF